MFLFVYTSLVHMTVARALLGSSFFSTPTTTLLLQLCRLLDFSQVSQWPVFRRFMFLAIIGVRGPSTAPENASAREATQL